MSVRQRLQATVRERDNLNHMIYDLFFMSGIRIGKSESAFAMAALKADQLQSAFMNGPVTFGKAWVGGYPY